MRVLLDSLRKTYADRNVRYVAVLLVSLVVIATGFYRWSEHWSGLDSLYFAVTMLVTTGAGDLVPRTVAGKVFTIFYIVVGLALFLALIQFMADDFLRRIRHAGDDDEPDAARGRATARPRRLGLTRPPAAPDN